MEKPTTYITREEQATIVKTKVCQLLGWTDFEYAQYQYQHGISYLMWYLPCDEDARSQLERSKLYWNWFKNLWLCHDESLVSFTLSLRECSAEMLRGVYDDLHCPHALAIEVKPNAVVLNEIKNNKHAF
jgi:hypothetical protein